MSWKRRFCRRHFRILAGLCCFLAVIASALPGCGASGTTPTTPTAPTTPTTPTAATPTLSGVSVSGTVPATGATSQFTATATLSNGDKQNVTNQAAWQSSNEGVVTVSSVGVVTGIGFGEADVRATYQGVSGSQHVNLVGTTLLVVSAATDEAVPGASVDVAGRHFTTDSGGRVTLSVPPFGSPIDIVASGYLDRRTTFRPDQALYGTRFSLWPKTSTSGLTEAFTRAVVYNVNFSNPAGTPRPLLRPDEGQLPIVLLGSLASDREKTAAAQSGIDQVNRALAGHVRFFLSAPVTGPHLEVEQLDFRDNQLDRVCFGGGACCICDWQGHGKITMGSAVDRPHTLQNIPGTLAHEMGHAFGLGHTPNESDPDVMGYSGVSRLTGAFTERERLIIWMMFQRPRANRWPDDDPTR